VTERIWRATEMVAAIKARGGEHADRYAEDLDGIERRLLLGLLDPADECGLETVYWLAFGETFDEALMRPRGNRAAELRDGEPEGPLPEVQPSAQAQAGPVSVGHDRA
jgi:hypothetical protein